MVFNSYIFLFLFLPMTLLIYFGLNRVNTTVAEASLLLMSFWFYGYFNPYYLLLLIGSIIVNYTVTYYMQRTDVIIVRKVFLWLGILFDVGLLFYYKYYGFFVSNVNTIFGTDFAIKKIILPLGISFFSFQQISYVVDCYKDRSINYPFLKYSLFVSFFPQLIAGPIVLHSELIPQFNDASKRKWNWDNFSVGLMIFTTGMFKKVILADSFSKIVDWGFIPENMLGISSVDTWIVMLSYTFQIYFDFSGYSDMAIGLGRMFNLILPQNFNSPYRALSIYEFWKRWHITLTRFLRTYVYYPLGGNRKSKARTYFNNLVVFLVSGIWHGANWTFIVWGLLHGVAMIIYKMFKDQYNRIVIAVRWFVNFLIINISFLLFRSESIKQWIGLLKKLFVFKDMSSKVYVDDTFFKAIISIQNVVSFPGGSYGLFAYVIFPIIVISMIIVCLRGKNTGEKQYCYSIRSILVTSIALLMCIVSFSKEMVFIYYNF